MSAFNANTLRVEVFECGKKITFISNSNDKFEVPIEYAILSLLVNDSLSFNPDDPNPEVPLPNISTPTLEKLIQFMIEYSKEPFGDIPKPIPKDGLKSCIRFFYNEFLDDLEMVSDNLKKQSRNNDDNNLEPVEETSKSCTSIMELLLAASFLQIESLKKLCIAHLAYQLREKNFTQVKSMFKCTDLNWDYNKMKDIHDQHSWCFDKNTETANNTAADEGSL
jgi:hypothetical protein